MGRKCFSELICPMDLEIFTEVCLTWLSHVRLWFKCRPRKLKVMHCSRVDPFMLRFGILCHLFGLRNIMNLDLVALSDSLLIFSQVSTFCSSMFNLALVFSSLVFNLVYRIVSSAYMIGVNSGHE